MRVESSSSRKWPSHGGQPEEMKRLFKLSEDRALLDFSANLNPLGPPEWLRDALMQSYEALTHYPDPTYLESKIAIACSEGVHPNQVLVTNGGAEAIFLTAKLFEGQKALIVQPTFVEYEQACQHYHIDTEDVFLDPLNEFQFPIDQVCSKMNKFQVIFICRPNNPTGTLIDEEALKRILDQGLETGTSIVIDEAFVDFLPLTMTSLTHWIETYPNLILLRSLTKMYTIPGLRVGYMLAQSHVIEKLEGTRVPWSVNAIATTIIPMLLENDQFLVRTREWLQFQLQKLRSSLRELDFYMSPTSVNYYLLKDHKKPLHTEKLFTFLMDQGILARHTHNFKSLDGHYLRLAVRSEAENKELLHALRKWREEV
jgi:threonine-phosphate decarboxylase